MTGHHLADALPEAGVPFDHAPHMIHRITIRAVEAADDGVEVFTVRFRQRLNLTRHQHVRGGVPVAACIILKVILRLQRLGLRPLLHHRHPADHGICHA